MAVFNKIKIEFVVLSILTISIFLSFNLDYLIHNYIQQLNYGIRNNYLKEFFVNITKLGSSSWYFVISLFCVLILFINKRYKIINLVNTNRLIKFFLSSLIYLLAVGLVTQIIKHLIGRPRPNHINFEQPFEFNFLSLDSSFHSYPSGHASTIFIVCLIFSSTLPKLKYFFYFLASVIALSRVVVGAHFFTDIIAGCLLSIIIFKILNTIVELKYKNFSFFEYSFRKYSQINYFIIFLLCSSLFTTIGPTIDLYTSSLFYYGNSQFFLQSHYVFSKIIREGFLPIIIIYTLLLPIVGLIFNINKFLFGYNFSFKEIVLIWFSQTISVVLFTNLILKNYWGRARPGDISGFGGSDIFTPWYRISDACETNCSFVSGDASVGFSIIILYFITKNILFFYLSVISGFVLGFTRIIAGAHFLSDVFFAGLFVILLNLIIFSFYKKYYEK